MSRRTLVVALVIAALSLMTLAGVVLGTALAFGAGPAFGDRIGVLEVDGLIADDAAVLEQLRRFRDDATIKALVVSINSPGGVVGPSQSIYRELRRLGDERDLPVVAAIGAVGASGGYLVALAADTIFVLPGSITGSIGVIMEFPDASELLGKVGIDMQVVKSAEHKDVGSPFRPITETDRALLNAVVQDVYAQFVEVVEERRGLDRTSVEAVADGRILTGRQALAGGLVDRIGNVHDAVAAAGRMAGLDGEPRVAWPVEKGFGLLDLILGRGAGVLEGALRPLDPGVGPRLGYILTY